MPGQSVLIRVPATVGNFGGAGNSAAVALDASLNVKASRRPDGRLSIRYFGEQGERVPRDRSNLLVKAFEAALGSKGLQSSGADFEIYSSVPVGVGLGSSTASVLAGLLAADRLYQLDLEENQLFGLAAAYDSRCDSLRAAWLGGFVACAGDGSYRNSPVGEKFTLNVVIPEAPLVPAATDERAEEPAPRQAQSAGLDVVAGLPNWLARARLADSDLLDSRPSAGAEEKSGVKFVLGLDEALQVATSGLLGVFLCGSGPAVGILEEGLSHAVKLVRDCFARHGVASRHVSFRASNAGARDWNAVLPDVTLPRAPALASPDRKISLIPV